MMALAFVAGFFLAIGATIVLAVCAAGDVEGR